MAVTEEGNRLAEIHATEAVSDDSNANLFFFFFFLLRVWHHSSRWLNSMRWAFQTAPYVWISTKILFTDFYVVITFETTVSAVL